jgi:uncharacterized protein (UPF0333 family)
MVEEKNNKQCPQCKSEIASGAKKCPFCQSDVRNSIEKHPLLVILLVIIIVIVFVSLFTKKSTPSSAPQTKSVSQTKNEMIHLESSASRGDPMGVGIANKSNATWSNCTIYLNDLTYSAYILEIKPGISRYSYSDFTKKDGTRFNYYTTQIIDIYGKCENPYGDFYANF